MDALLSFFQKNPMIFLWLLIALVIIVLVCLFLFRKELGRLLGRVKVSTKGVTLGETANDDDKSSPDESAKAADAAKASVSVADEGRKVDIDFGQENRFLGQWSNIAFGGDVVVGETMPRKKAPPEEKKADPHSSA